MRMTTTVPTFLLLLAAILAHAADGTGTTEGRGDRQNEWSGRLADEPRRGDCQAQGGRLPGHGGRGTRLTVIGGLDRMGTGRRCPRCRSLPDLVVLHLEVPTINDDDLANLHNLKNLKTLVIRSRSIGGIGLKHLTGLKKLEDLNLYDTTMGNRGLRYIAGMTGLERLSLPGTVTEQGLAALRGMPHLRGVWHRAGSATRVRHTSRLRGQTSTPRIVNPPSPTSGCETSPW